MANWDSLLDSPPSPKSGLVFISYGDDSALVWDRVGNLASHYEIRIDVKSHTDLAYYIPTARGVAYVMKNPTEKMMDSLSTTLRGGSSDSFFLIFAGSDAPTHRDIDYIKRKSQVHKAYFNVAPPKSEKTRDWMETFFSMRWGVTKEQSSTVCMMLDYQPGNLYQFDKQYRAAGGDGSWSSSKAQEMLDKILGDSSSNLAISRILMRKYVNGRFDGRFNEQALSYLSYIVENSASVQASMLRANQTVSSIAKDSGLTQYQVLSTLQVASEYTRTEIMNSREMIRLMSQYRDEPEMLEVLSRVWTH